jgi:hypothetical protein
MIFLFAVDQSTCESCELCVAYWNKLRGFPLNKTFMGVSRRDWICGQSIFLNSHSQLCRCSSLAQVPFYADDSKQPVYQLGFSCSPLLRCFSVPRRVELDLRV